MTAHVEDTICAIATPIGEGGIGIVRISGPDSLVLASKVVSLRRERSLEDMRSHTMYLANIVLPAQEGEGSSMKKHAVVLDEVLVVAMRAPRSYTGEEVIEIHCHGGQLVLTKVCEALIRYGARLAEPGEFTRRAFLHERLDLTQAEAVLDTIRATTTRSLEIAQEQLKGTLSTRVDEMRDELIRLLAHVEAGLDFVEEDISFVGQEELKSSLQSLSNDIGQLLETAEEGRMLREGVIAAIIGKPNAGKSSLLNTLLETNRAIVSSIPGTTRDVLEEVINLQGVLLRLRDTAGLRDAGDELEMEGMRRTHEAQEEAGLLMIVIDASQELTEEDIKLMTCVPAKKRILVLNKTDLPGKTTEADVFGVLHHELLDAYHDDTVRIVAISAKTGEGIDRLRYAVRSIVGGSLLESRDSVIVTRLRHKQALASAQAAITNSVQAIAQQLSTDCVAIDLRVALDALGEITGSTGTEDILDRVFKEFCIGK